MFDVVLITEKQYINPTSSDWFINQIQEEESIVQKSLKKKGLKVGIKGWDDETFDWSLTTSALFRTTWNYFHRLPEFLEWLTQTKEKTTLMNSFQQILWNINKHYLLDLQAKGIPIVETIFVEKHTQTTLQTLHDQMGWNETVLKPVVSGAARHTYRVTPITRYAHEKQFQNLLKNESLMLQPFQSQILTKGEMSHIVIGGQYTHSILKKAKKGDYRVQDDFGGTVHPYKANSKEKEFSEQVVQACSPLPFYARVDLIWDNKNQLALSELELIEPELWFRKHPQAAEKLSESIAKHLT